MLNFHYFATSFAPVQFAGLLNAEQNRGYPRLKPTARYREQRSKAGQDSGQMSGFDARESAN
ncbi:hypothetical protein [Thermoleptolyngbya sp.]